MVQTIQTRNVTLRDLIANFGLQLVRDEQFFREWQDDSPVTDLQKQLLDQVKEGYFNLLDYPPLLEGVVRMAVLDPILFIGGFYLFPFHVKAENPVKISTEDEGVIVTGSLDVLVLKEQLWVMVIESRQAEFSIEAGLAQMLSYMLGNSHLGQPSFGMITTGGTFIFIKLVKRETPHYATSAEFSLRNPGNDLHRVLGILKHLSQLATSA